MAEASDKTNLEGVPDLDPPTWKPSLRPEFRVKVPVPRAPTFMVARTEILDLEPSIKKEILDKFYNMFTQDDVIVVSPNDPLDRLYTIFQSVILPEVEAYINGHMTHAEFSAFLGDGYINNIITDFTKATRVLEDPALFGTTYAGTTNVKGKDRFECTWRGYTEIDKYNDIFEFIIIFLRDLISGQTLKQTLYFSQLQGHTIALRHICQSLCDSAKFNQIQFTLLKQRMEHYEKLVVFADAQTHKLHDELKAMQIVCLEATLETKAMCSEIANVLVKVIQTVSKDVSEDKALSHIFGDSEDFATVSAKEGVKAQSRRPFPTFDDLLNEAIARTKKISLNDIKDKDPDVLVCHMDPKYKARPNPGKDYSPYRKAMERRRDSSTHERASDEDVKFQFASMIRNRAPTPVVNCGVVNFNSTQEEIDALKETLNTKEVKGNAKRRHGVIKTVEQQARNRLSRTKGRRDQMAAILEEASTPPTTDDEAAKQGPSKPPPKSPKSGAVPKRPTARKSTTTPKKLKRLPTIDPLDLIKKNPTASDITNLDELKIKEELIDFSEAKEMFANNNPKVPDSSDELIEVSD